MLTKTLVSSGSEDKVLFKAVCISAAVPSKNLPQPVIAKLLVTEHRARRAIGQQTSMKERIACKDNLSSLVFHEPTNTILCMTWCV